MKGESMICPKCEENSLAKIQFIGSKKIAYLCDACQSFWFVTEHITAANGHMLEEYIDDQHAENLFMYVHEKDEEQRQIADDRERIAVRT